MKDGRSKRGLRGWINGSIRRKLTVLLLTVCLLLISLVYVLVIQLLEPVYESNLRADLERTAHSIVAIMDSHEAAGGSVVMGYENWITGVRGETMSTACKDLINNAMASGELPTRERSIDIANENNLCIAMLDTSPDSILHPVRAGTLGGLDEAEDPNNREKNGELVTQLRVEAQESGSIYYKLYNGQMIVGASTANGMYTVVVAANVERISQAVTVFRQLMLPVAVILVLLSVAAAWLFSRWFTRPLEQLSHASRELARGNYDVQVSQQGHDEIATLAGDFNQMAREVERSAALQRDLIANVSHDLRTPLTLIKGYAETVRDLTGDNAKRRTEQMDVIVDEADRLSTLVGRVMELSRMSSGNEKPEPVYFDLAQLCDEVGYRYGEFSTAHDYSFTFEADDEPCRVYADPALVERVLDNLLGNALHHVGADGYIGLTVHKTGTGKVRVEVIDHGEGINPDDLPYIFDRYYRSRRDTGKTGTGLGLSITKAIFVAQNFDYGVQSEPGEGATFWFEVPLAQTT